MCEPSEGIKVAWGKFRSKLVVMYGNGNCTLTVSYHRGVVTSPHRNYVNPHRVCVTIASPSSKFTNICTYKLRRSSKATTGPYEFHVPHCWFCVSCCILLLFFAVFSPIFALRGTTIWLPIGAISRRLLALCIPRPESPVIGEKVRASGCPSSASCYIGWPMWQSCVSARRSHADVTAKFKSKYKLLLVGPAVLFTAQIFVLLFRSGTMHFTCSRTLPGLAPQLYADVNAPVSIPIIISPETPTLSETN